MRALLLLLLSSGFMLAACDDEPETDTALREEAETVVEEGDPNFTSTEQVYAGRPDVPERADMPPALALERFFDVLQRGDVDVAAALVAKQPLQIDEAELERDILQWRENLPEQTAFEILGTHEQGDFAIARARFAGPGGGPPAERPVVLFQEEGEWKVVWDLIGKEPEQVAADFVQRLGPLYDWYNESELRGGVEGGDLPGQGVMETTDEPDMEAQTQQAPRG